MNGIYYDWFSETYRFTGNGNSQVGWGYTGSNVSGYSSLLPNNTDISSISFGKRNGVNGAWYSTANVSSQSRIGIPGSPNFDATFSVDYIRRFVPAGQGGNLLKDLTDITGWASTIRTAGEMDWNSMTKAQQQKVAYNMQKSLKSNGTRMYTRDIKANINGNFKSLNYKLGAASGALIVADVVMTGEIRPSHVVNGIMTGVGLTGWGSPVAAVYFLTDLGMGLFYDGGLSGYIDDTWGSPLYDF